MPYSLSSQGVATAAAGLSFIVGTLCCCRPGVKGWANKSANQIASLTSELHSGMLHSTAKHAVNGGFKAGSTVLSSLERKLPRSLRELEANADSPNLFQPKRKPEIGLPSA